MTLVCAKWFMATILRFEDLEIWKLARNIYNRTSLLATKIKLAHDYRFADQMKGAAGSIMDNIAEGFERNSQFEFVNALGIAKGEAGELKSQQHRALDDKYISQEEFETNYSDIDLLIRKISKLISYLNSSNTRGLKFKGR
jgi:four helix bundle protein